MGYTHYFPAMRYATPAEWAAIVEQTKIVLQHLPDEITLGSGTKQKLRLARDEDYNMAPQVGPMEIIFNGSDLAAHYRTKQRRPISRDPAYPAKDESTWHCKTFIQEFHSVNEVAYLTQRYKNLGHETFWLEPEPSSSNGYTGSDNEYPLGFQFCKTAEKPYDLAVCSVLILCHTLAPGFLAISSDGSRRDWMPAFTLVKLLLPDLDLQMPIGR